MKKLILAITALAITALALALAASCGGKATNRDAGVSTPPPADTVTDTAHAVHTVHTANAGTDNTPPIITTFTDSRDGKTYRAVKIGGQVWMGENLNYEIDGSRCYENSPDSCAKYGRLYYWIYGSKLYDMAKVCPAGWHLPSRKEWARMRNFVGGTSTGGTKLKSSTGWNGNRNGTDDYGFSALPGGYGGSDGSFNDAGYGGHWRSVTEFDVFHVFAYYTSVYHDKDGVYGTVDDEGDGRSVRCVQDAPQITAATTFTDNRDGKTYRTVKIGGQVWIGENLNYETADSKCSDDKETNCEKYGRLYNWGGAKSACPAGWHLPDDKEWTALTDYVDGSSTAGTKLKRTEEWTALADYAGATSTAGEKLKSSGGWDRDGYGTDDYGFSALPGGLGFSDGKFANVGYFAYWWSGTEYDAGRAWYRYMYYGYDYTGRSNYDKSNLFSVRCVQDGGRQ